MNKLLGWIVGSRAVEYLKKAQTLLSGWKTYTAGGILILQAVSGLLEQFIGLNGLSDLLGFLRNVHENPELTKFAEGLGLIGLRAGVSKLAAKPESPPAA